MYQTAIGRHGDRICTETSALSSNIRNCLLYHISKLFVSDACMIKYIFKQYISTRISDVWWKKNRVTSTSSDVRQVAGLERLLHKNIVALNISRTFCIGCKKFYVIILIKRKEDKSFVNHLKDIYCKKKY